MRGPVDVWGAIAIAAAMAAMATTAACSGPTSDSATPPTTVPPRPVPVFDADPAAVRIPAPVPPGDIRITYACSHSAKPFGSTHWSQSSVFDLATGRAVVDRAEGDDDDPDKTRTTHTETILPPDRVAAIRASLARVLAGGPYRPEYALPEGVACTLSLWIPGEKAFFTIEKAGTAEADAISQLVRDLGI